MDIIVNGTVEDLVEAIKEIGFRVTKTGDYFSGITVNRGGGMHILFKQIEGGEIYCDLHWDGLIHFMGLGVDYRAKPKKFYEEKLGEELWSRGLRSYVIGGFTWSTRKNKALLSGLKLQVEP